VAGAPPAPRPSGSLVPHLNGRVVEDGGRLGSTHDRDQTNEREIRKRTRELMVVCAICGHPGPQLCYAGSQILPVHGYSDLLWQEERVR